MARQNSIFNIIGMHRSQHLRETLEHETEIAAERNRSERKRQLRDIILEIRDNMATQEEYDQWWESTPDNKFFDAACAKLLAMKLTPDPLPKSVQVESDRIQAWLSDNWDSLPEIEF